MNRDDKSQSKRSKEKRSTASKATAKAGQFKPRADRRGVVIQPSTSGFGPDVRVSQR